MDFVRDGSGSVRGPPITSSEGEQAQRYLAIEMTRNLVLLVAVFVDRSQPAVAIYENQIG